MLEWTPELKAQALERFRIKDVSRVFGRVLTEGLCTFWLCEWDGEKFARRSCHMSPREAEEEAFRLLTE